MDKKTKLKKILGSLTTFDDQIEGTFKSLDDEMEKVTKKLRETITAKTLDQVNDKFKELQNSFKPLATAFNELKDNLVSRETKLISALEDKLKILNDSVQEGRNEDAIVTRYLEDSILEVKKALEEVKGQKFTIPDFGAQIEQTESRLKKLIEAVQEGVSKIDTKEYKKDLKEIEKDFKTFKTDTINRFGNLGGGSANQKISVNGTVMSTKYADFNLTGSGITATDNNTTKQVDISLSGLVGGSSLADVSADSTDATKSLYTMTSTIPVEFRSSDGNTILYIDETNEFIRTTKLVGSTSTTGDLTLQTTTGVGAAGADMHFLVGNNGATEAMTILNNGNVGIGTTAPDSISALHVKRTGNSVIVIEGAVPSFQLRHSGAAADNQNVDVIVDSSGSGLHRVVNDANTVASTYLKVTRTGTTVDVVSFPNGQVSVVPTTASTSTTTGSLINAGGFGNAGNIYAGGTTINLTNSSATSFVAVGPSSITAILQALDATTVKVGSATTGASLVLMSGNGTTAATFDSSQNTTLAGDLTVSGGNVGVGGAAAADRVLVLESTGLTGVSQFGIVNYPVFTSAATTSGATLYAQMRTAAASFTMGVGETIKVLVPSLGAGSAITTQSGITVANQGATGITNAYGIDIAAQSGAATTNVGLRNASNTVWTPDTLSGAGAVSVASGTTALTSTGAGEAITLANGVAGQIKTIVHDVDGGSMVLTPATKTGFTTVTFTNAGDTVTLQYFTTRGWMVLSSFGATVA